MGINMKEKEQILQLQKEIKNNVAVNDDVICPLCDQLFELATRVNDHYAIAFSYIWKADYFFYVQSDTAMVQTLLMKAQQYINQEEYTPLLEKFYALKSVYYQVSLDNHKSFQYSLKSLEVSEALSIDSRTAINYGNIGDVFLSQQQYQEALLYTTKALEILEKDIEKNKRLIRIVLSNLIGIYSHLNMSIKLQEAIVKMESLSLEPKDIKIYLDLANVMYYVTVKNREKIIEYVHKLIEDGVFHLPNRAYAIEIITNAFQAVIGIKEETYAKKLLSMLEELLDTKEVIQELEYCKLCILFNKTFNKQEKLQEEYKKYYPLYMTVEKQNIQLKAETMKTRLQVVDSLKQHNETIAQVRSLETEAHIDGLTKIYNRRYLNIKQTEIINNTKMKTIGLIIVDVDYFKEYNDSNGHQAGDQVLKEVATLLKEAAPKKMAVCRYGGDEFVCVSWNLTIEEQQKYIKRIQKRVYKKNIMHTKSGCADRITMSIGYGNFILPLNTSIFAIVEEVDQALYEAKKEGRNRAIQSSGVGVNENEK